MNARSALFVSEDLLSFCYLLVIKINVIFMSWTATPSMTGLFVAFCELPIASYTVIIRPIEMCWQGPFHYWWTWDIASDYDEWFACWSQCRWNTAVSPGFPIHWWAWGGVPSRLEARTRNGNTNIFN